VADTDLNKVIKTDYVPVKISYTSKDYASILDDLIASVSGITEKWQVLDESDPGVIMIKLMSIIGDMLFYTQDQQALEVYPNSVTQRKNAATIYKLIGYKMRWYRSATLTMQLVNTYSSGATLPRFCTFTTQDGITYTTFKQYELKNNMSNNGVINEVELVQGIPVTPVRVSSNPYPGNGKPWHSIYGYNYTTDDLVNNRIYLPDKMIDDTHIILVDDSNEEWKLRDNIYLTTSVGKYYEFGVDVNDNPYIEIIDYWGNFNISKFKLFTIRTLGEDGEILANTLKNCTGNCWALGGTPSNPITYNVQGFLSWTHEESSWGYNYETPDEARKNIPKFQNTIDTLITLADFERATLRIDGVANVRATDLTNDPGISVNFSVGDINEDGKIDSKDYNLLNNFLADPTSYPLTPYQRRLANCKGSADGIITSEDLKLLGNYIAGNMIDASGKPLTGNIGIKSIPDIETLTSFVVKLYILRTEAYEDYPDDAFETSVKTTLQEYKILPLQIVVDLHSITNYYWTIKGTFMTKTPLSRDELQTIMVNINNQLRYKYSIEKVNFNTTVNYREIIETILAVDSRILMVDLDPIQYTDVEGNIVPKEQVTGKYKYYVDQLHNEKPSDNLDYSFTIPNVPLLPGSVMFKLRTSNDEYTLRDNNNGAIYNIDGILQRNGKIDYQSGEVTLSFNMPINSNIEVNYVHNECTIARYENLSTNSFYYEPGSLEKAYMQDLI
jgi:hypothetical protein